MPNQYFAIIVAGGSGKRMHSSIPKQFLLLNGKPILMHTIEKFHKSSYHPEIVLVLSESDIELWHELTKKHQFSIPHKIVPGGAERFFSVKNGLAILDDLASQEESAIVAIHDAVRPLVSISTIDRSYETAKKHGNAVTAVASRDSVRLQNQNGNQSVSRENVYLIQTPQTFNYKQLKQAYLNKYNTNFTDDASVVEASGYSIFIEEGDQFNIKITFPEDIIFAESFLKLNEK
ncbi:2-C-methyl-D-erythritol 4-phosphate cytidylyltransferase [Pseudopedobacter saltans DSM 12145]|uniref:2-C-methyl-D-erythritol 4-phosphate cytidylyltransferase n=1 Tax=Pseudopedobacter saltans (strain ATCC 51119 / DSM 12145 / JCM 21818 / CCUG 39354 / LMG 10337 / NBRC 100064 / NCIMB 13643) TaxID=762903 RepID=F0SC99_PSESL|nr:2-C-methyl-D-erythritol 4-phosphate cytidylyltransferase [Pseudopedobacter saltans]ADY51696.1 2-C-methyl-D-erythritol 4-phosphate cytidylyltransferase [Pseudopedobacter saltans DSM 12145]